MSEHDDVSRRQALRSGLATGLAVFAGGVVCAGRARAQPQDQEDDAEGQPKIAQSVVHYQNKWSAQNTHCGICANFVAPNTCQVVAGVVNANGYCLVFSLRDLDLGK